MDEQKTIEPTVEETKTVFENDIQTAKEEDLDKLRDEKIFPLADDCLSDLVDLGFPGEVDGKTNLGPVTLSILDRALEADLNHITELPYLFQRMLTILSELNKTVQESEFTPIDDARYNEIAKTVLSRASTPDILGEINHIFAEENLNKFEVNYVMQLIFTTFQNIQQSVMSSVDTSMKKAEEQIWGCDLESVTLKQIDRMLKG